MCRFHTIEKVTDYGARQVLFKRGNKILAWAEERPSLNWEFFIGKPSIRPHIVYIAKSYIDAEQNIIKLLKVRNEV